MLSSFTFANQGMSIGNIPENEITLFDFLYADIHEEDFPVQEQEHWNIAKGHYAIEVGIINHLSAEYFEKDKKG